MCSLPVDHAALRRLAEAKGSPDLLLSSAVVLALLGEIEGLEREVAKGFTVEVAAVTNDAATLAECGRLRAEVERLERALERAWRDVEVLVSGDAKRTIQSKIDTALDAARRGQGEEAGR